jgi:hypothetical protein
LRRVIWLSILFRISRRDRDDFRGTVGFGRRAFLSHNGLFQVSQRGRKYPLEAGIGLFRIRACAVLQGRLALRPFAYTTVATQVFGGSGGRL